MYNWKLNSYLITAADRQLDIRENRLAAFGINFRFKLNDEYIEQAIDIISVYEKKYPLKYPDVTYFDKEKLK